MSRSAEAASADPRESWARRRRSGGVPDQLPEHTVAPAALVDAVPRRPGRLGTAAGGKAPRMSHIIGRPNDDLLDVMLGHGADPEQVFVDGSEQGLEEGDGFEDRLLGEEPTAPEL